jgi:hypothetical protein
MTLLVAIWTRRMHLMRPELLPLPFLIEVFC